MYILAKSAYAYEQDLVSEYNVLINTNFLKVLNIYNYNYKYNESTYAQVGLLACTNEMINCMTIPVNLRCYFHQANRHKSHKKMEKKLQHFTAVEKSVVVQN